MPPIYIGSSPLIKRYIGSTEVTKVYVGESSVYGQSVSVGDEVITSVSTIRAGESFTITGTGLIGATQVKINGVACSSVVVVSNTTITAVAPINGFMHDELYTLEVL